MRLRTPATLAALLLALALLSSPAAVVRARRVQQGQADDDGAVRGAFRNTRKGAKPAEKKKDKDDKGDGDEDDKKRKKADGDRRDNGGDDDDREKKREKIAAHAKGGKRDAAPVELKASAPASVGPLLAPASSASGAERPAGIALGYTLFMRAPTGEAKRVSATREFRSGDSVRLMIETNTDGYLYIFNAENDGAALMIFPNARLQRGANFIRAHVPYEIPSSAEPDENLRWLSFDDRPATERVYFVVSRKPLEGVPAGEGLVRWCAETGSEACAWAPKDEQWDKIKKWAKREQVATSRAADDGRAETPAEHEAATRGLGLAADAPLPSVIYMITAASADVLVATVDLIHR